MSSRIESFELRSSRDKHEPQDPPPAYYPAQSHEISRPSLFFGLYLVLPALAIAAAISLGFKAYVATKDVSDIRFGQWLGEEDVLMAQWPSSLFQHQLELPIWVAAMALVTSVLTGILLLLVMKSGPLQASYSRRLGILVHLGLNAALALAGTIYMFVLNATSAMFDLQYALSVTPESSGTFTYDQGTFNGESWACLVRALPNFDADLVGIMARTCDLEIGARWLTLFTCIFTIGLFSLLYLDSRGGRYFMRP